MPFSYIKINKSRKFYKTYSMGRTDIQVIAENNKISNNYEIPKNGWLAMYFFKYARVATLEQVVAFSGIKDTDFITSSQNRLFDIEHDEDKYRSFYLLSSQGVSLLNECGIRVFKNSFDKERFIHEIGVTETILKEVKYGWTAISREFVKDGITPDLYIERSGRTSFFIDFIDSNSTRGQLLERFVKYGKSQYIESRDSYLHVYYSLSESEDINERKDLIVSALLDQSVRLSAFGNGTKVYLTAINIDDIILLKRETEVYVSEIQVAT